MLPRWTEETGIESLDLRTVFAEAEAQRKSAYSVLKDAGWPVFKFVTDHEVGVEALPVAGEIESKAAVDADPGLITLIASTNATDLVGDMMEQTALEQMKAAAPGTSVFLNHSYRLPDDLFGTVVKAELVNKTLTNPINNERQEYLCLVYQVAPVSREENPKGFQVYQMLAKGKRKLGASVTVLILEKNEKPDGKRSIKQVFYIETSMVGVPCNQLSWAQYAFAALHPDKGQKSNQPAKTSESEAMEPIEKTEPVSKGLYADKVKSKTQKFWFMVETLEGVIYDLKAAARQKQKLDFGALLGEACDEFKAAVVEAVLPVLQNMPESGYDYGYYSLFDPQAGSMVLDAITQKMLSEMDEATQKAGARNNKYDMDTIQKMHDNCCSLGAKCSKDNCDAAKSLEAAETVSVETTGEMVSKADLETSQTELTNKALEAESLLKQVAELQAELKTKSQECDKWKLSALAVGAKVSELASEPVPRAGQSV